MQELKDLEQDYNNILGCSTSLLDALKERESKIKKILEKNGEYFDKLEDALKENQELKQDNEEKGRIIENLKEDMNDLRLEQINKPLKK